MDGSLNLGGYDAVTGVQAACARVVTDRAAFARLRDVHVDPATRGKGLGVAMVARVREELRAFGPRRILLATHDAHGVHARLGFEPLARPDDRMALQLG
jgi:GNAT superfamily N-acetyltransferase